ncbi:lycopene epsilon cyclase1 [Zea mays]|uniref:RING-type E3 ubiquitin transferase n=1 Tax=Zea mays TaxID=4577 RepID=A0A1D6FXT4_MAIZE|nr:lycopene epsilon cyclase1 [Zea mays]
MQGGPLSPDEYWVISPPALLHQPASTIVVAIDRDRNSQLAVKWVVDHLLSGASHIVLLHVAVHYHTTHGFAMVETTQGALEAEMKEIFVPYRGFFNRNGVEVSEVVLEEADVSKAILGYITANKIQSIALRLRNLGHAYEARMSAARANGGSGESGAQISGDSTTVGGSWETADS